MRIARREDETNDYLQEMSESGIEINPHVLGAYQLLVFRGPGQNASELSSALMSHTITQLVRLTSDCCA